MSTSSIFFFLSLMGMLALITSKWAGLYTGRPTFLTTFFSRFDVRVAGHLTRLTIFVHRARLIVREFISRSVHRLKIFLTVYLHRLLEIAERRVRAWREVARERTIERKSASMFIKDVVEYKNQLKQNNRGV